MASPYRGDSCTRDGSVCRVKAALSDILSLLNHFLTLATYDDRQQKWLCRKGLVVSDVADAAEEEIDLDDDFDVPKKKLSGKKIVLFFVLPFLLLGVGAGVFFSGMLGSDAKEKPVAETEAVPVAPLKTVFFDLPEMLVNLNSTGRRPSFLKMRVSLELTSDLDVTRVRDLSPRIIDNFQVYLRELRVEDLKGSAGIYRLREELLARVNTAVRPTKVKDVLFKDMLVQ